MKTKQQKLDEIMNRLITALGILNKENSDAYINVKIIRTLLCDYMMEELPDEE